MSISKALFIAPELPPFLEISAIAQQAAENIKCLQDSNCEVRVLMPRFGLVNERRHRLHEVIRLSGKSITVRDKDYLMIVKVASLPGFRIQTYFVDNDDLFARKQVYFDAKKRFFADNDERLAFFSKGAVTMLNQVGWIPDVIHFYGWFSSLVLLYIHALKQDPNSAFNNTKLIYSAYGVDENCSLGENFLSSLPFPDLPSFSLPSCKDGDIDTLQLAAASRADGVVFNSEDSLVLPLIEQTVASGVPVYSSSQTTILEVYKKTFINADNATSV